MKRKLLYLFLLLSVWFFAWGVLKAKAESPDLSYDQRLENWVQQVRWEESRGHDMLVILDTNNKYSYGCLQFQMATWNNYSKKYGITEEIMNCDAQIKLTKLIVQNEKKGYDNWWTTVHKKGVGLPPEHTDV